MSRPVVGVFKGFRQILHDDEILMKLCYATGVDAVIFTQADVDFDKETINAQVWTADGFVREVVGFPRYVECGACPVSYREKFAQKSIVIDDFTLSKKDVNDVLINSPFASCVIPTLHTYKQAKILSFAQMWGEVVVKPLVGARGEGIICIRTQPDGFIFTNTQGDNDAFGYEESVKCLKKLFEDCTVIVQPRMNFRSKDGRMMDFRLNVAKNREGRWSTVFMIARTSRGSIISNINAGGYASSLEGTLEAEYGEVAPRIKNALEDIADRLPDIIEEASACHMLSMGLDVGIDRDTLQPYIIEVNYVPQVHYYKCEYISRKADYFMYLQENLK